MRKSTLQNNPKFCYKKKCFVYLQGDILRQRLRRTITEKNNGFGQSSLAACVTRTLSSPMVFVGIHLTAGLTEYPGSTLRTSAASAGAPSLRASLHTWRRAIVWATTARHSSLMDEELLKSADNFPPLRVRKRQDRFLSLPFKEVRTSWAESLLRGLPVYRHYIDRTRRRAVIIIPIARRERGRRHERTPAD